MHFPSIILGFPEEFPATYDSWESQGNQGISQALSQEFLGIPS